METKEAKATKDMMGQADQVQDQGDGTIKLILTSEREDRDGEVIKVGGVDYSNYMSTNPVVLWAHDSWSMPIGKMLSITPQMIGGYQCLVGQIQLAVDILPEAAAIYKLFQNGYLNTGSIGFIPKEVDGNTVVSCEMVEFTICNIPANAGAVRLALDEGAISTKQFENLTKKGAVSSDLPTADAGASWDAAAAISAVKDMCSDADGNIDFSKYQKAFFWVDPANKDKQGGYKLPFATVEDGKLVAVWRGVAAAMEALNGSRGGVELPDADKPKVYAQIKKYYAKFDQEAPPLKSFMDVAVKAGARNSAADQATLTGFLGCLADIDALIDGADVLIDQLQADMSEFLGVPNPDGDDPTYEAAEAAADALAPDTSDEAAAEASEEEMPMKQAEAPTIKIEPVINVKNDNAELFKILETLTALQTDFKRSGAVAPEDSKRVSGKKASTPPAQRSTGEARRVRVVAVKREAQATLKAAKAAQPALERLIRITRASNTN